MMLRRNTIAMCASALVSLAGCGGGGDMPMSSTPATSTQYAFVEPVLNSTRSYSEAVVDNSNNTIDLSYMTNVTGVNSDGSFTELTSSDDGSIIVNGTDYGIAATKDSYNNIGQETSYTTTDSNGNPLTCTFTPNGSGPPFPVILGQTWQLQFALACGADAPVNYTQTGSVVDVESVMVPAGTYDTLKLQSTVTWTDSQGTMRTQMITNWRDITTEHSVKQSISVAVSGTLPADGYAVSREILLQSASD